MRVVQLINDAISASDEKEKVKYLQQVQELVINNNDVLDNFLDEIIGFQTSSLVEVRKFVAGFISASCLKDPELFTKLIVNLNFALNDSNSHVVKKGIQVATQLYRVFLKWISRTKPNDVVESTCEVWWGIKTHIINLLETSENDGIRNQCIKFMESIVISQTKKDQWSPNDDFSVDMLEGCNLVDIDQLEEEARQTFEQLIIFHGTVHVSSINLIATMQSLIIIAKNRSHLFMSKVIQALESLHANLPPTLSKSQVTSVRKQLKVQLTQLLKHPLAATSTQYQSQIVQLLNDLGTGQSEVYRCLQEVRKRGLKVEQAVVEAKRVKLETPEEKAKNEAFTLPSPKVTRNDANTAIDITAEDLTPCLNNIANVCDLVLVSMLSLPETMPAHFLASYTPISAAGTPSQIKHLSRLIATQMTASGIGKGVEEMVNRAANLAKTKKLQNEELEQQQTQKIATLISRGIAQEVRKQEQSQNNKLSKIKLIPTGKSISGSSKFKQLSLSEITKEIPDDIKNKMVSDSISRLLSKDDKRLYFCPSQIETRNKILIHLSTEFNSHSFSVSNLVKTYTFADIRNRADLLFSLIYDEYLAAKKEGNGFSCYNKCITSILNEVIGKLDIKERENFLPRLFIEAPLINEEVIEILRNFIINDKFIASTNLGLTILKTLIEKKKSVRYRLLNVLLDLSLAPNKPDVRSNAIRTVKYLHETYGSDIKITIEKFGLEMLQRLLEPVPFKDDPEVTWNEENIKLFLLPYLSLLPNNHKLVHDLACVYVKTSPDIKRIILRVLDAPVKGMGMNSPQLLLLVETCPKGAETLVTRIIHVLTDKQPPSAELVSRVRDLYHKRVPDVRFLIPVLNGLTKKEVIAALPKLIKLNPVVVKEVFNRLLGTQVESGTNYQSPLTSADLLIALHNIDPAACDMKIIIKAIGYCFAEKHIYTAEVLAVVMQLLMEQNPLPTLLMRTVIQSLSLYSRLIGFVMNILQRLILKQVWKQKEVWEGFIKCCQRTIPQSFQVLLQLPAQQLENVFKASPDFKSALQEHVSSFSDTQRSHIPQSILDVIFADDLQCRPEMLIQEAETQ